MKRDDLSALVKLRRQRERTAMNALAAKQHQLRHAEGEFVAAAEAAMQNEQQARDQERERLARLIGQQLRPGEIATLQSSFNAAADRQRQLTLQARWADRKRQERQTETDAARAEFRKRHRQVEKLVLLQARLQAKAARRELAITETMTDELAGALPAGDPPATPRGE
jgi:hypothetical protein